MFGGIRGAFSRFFAMDGLFMAAGLAFFFLVCLIPLMLLGVSLVGFVLSTEQAAREVIGQLTRNFPVYKTEITAALMRIVRTRRQSGLIGIAVLIVFSTPLFGAVRLVMHRLLGIRAGRGFVRSFLVDTGMVVLLCVLLFAATVVTWVVQWFQDHLLELAPANLRWVPLIPVAFSVTLSAVMFYLGYRYVPIRHVHVLPALAGGILASLLWEVAKQLFRLYIRGVGVYDHFYGPLGVLIAVVMFVYYSAIVFVFGAAYVASLESRQRARPQA
jgi:membrane protein